MWVGVTSAGYAVEDETPIFILPFVVPVAVGAFVIRRRGGPGTTGEPPSH